MTAVQILSEIGGDMSVFPTAKHLVSWAGCCPRNDKSNQKIKSTRISRAGTYIKPLLVQIANSLLRSKKNPEITQRYKRIKARRGHKKAVIAVCRMFLTAIWHILSELKPYTPEGFLEPRPVEKSKVLTTAQALRLLKQREYVISDAAPALNQVSCLYSIFEATARQLVCDAIYVLPNHYLSVSNFCTSDSITLTASYKTKVFTTTNSDIAALHDWLLAQDCHDVCMESTDKYWIPIFIILEPHMHVVLTHPKYVKAIKGKKTDKRNAKQSANLFRFDIVKASFIPPADIRALRELSRYCLKLLICAQLKRTVTRTA